MLAKSNIKLGAPHQCKSKRLEIDLLETKTKEAKNKKTKKSNKTSKNANANGNKSIIN